ncbi:MAG: HAMP domain-containing histidine kinase [Acidimicrobiia bacterium]|nr:HAMP domain-containing histidine kinase [Acidimicrobiia bacterium]MBT8194023.1 HAMP domain-containing histidine kinase [Acidimicrobiia bacterium]NNF88532.1 HAMP domain-containing histidine kinase [Acidimicrobiia bacterium]NNL96951.1 HAMP domain-containing histidine kinase [Acidimicrobiia bacterium]RZV40690.1 MAG: HAMP domain-containing histidine kinase [Acidimicrobiia bacterium]
MSLRARIAATAAGAVAIAVLLVSVAAYAASSRSLRDEVDRDLEEAAAELVADPGQIVFGIIQRIEGEFLSDERFFDFGRRDGRSLFGPLPAGKFGGASGFVQVVNASGDPISLSGDIEVPADYDYLPVDDQVVAMAAGETAGRYYKTVDVDGSTVRILTQQFVPGVALQVARPLDEVEDSLNRLAVFLGVGGVAGVAVAAGLGLLVAQFAIRPVEALTASAEHVAETKDLSHRIERAAPDELGRLGQSFNTMLEALESSEDARRQLVADASHELRTPLTSLRTNIEVLADVDALSNEDRAGLVGDVVEQLDELNLLISDLIDAAREDEPVEALVPMDLDVIVKDAVERARRNHPEITFALEADPFVMRGEPRRVSRAVGNLLDNAAKWSPPSGAVEVSLDGGVLTVRDHGPGIAEEDIDNVFDRFYRSTAARSMPGSGLGLSIVEQVAGGHGGTVVAENHPGGGALLTLTFPPISSDS